MTLSVDVSAPFLSDINKTSFKSGKGSTCGLGVAVSPLAVGLFKALGFPGEPRGGPRVGLWGKPAPLRRGPGLTLSGLRCKCGQAFRPAGVECAERLGLVSFYRLRARGWGGWWGGQEPWCRVT